MTSDERKAYMKINNQTEKAKAAKLRWRKSDAGILYHRQYNEKYELEERNKQRKAEKQKIRRQTCPNRKAIDKQYAYEYTRRKEVRLRINAKRRVRRQTDTSYRLTERIRGRIKDLLGRDRPESVSRSLGCSAQQLMVHLESKFKLGMTWENYGFYGWHIDHIIPLSSFDLTDVDQFRKACHYTNLQPLWASENLKKGSKLTDSVELEGNDNE